MSDSKTSNFWLPEHLYTQEKKPRRVGVEIELAGLQPDTMLSVIQSLFGGNIEHKHSFCYEVTDTNSGKFKLELDAQLLQKIDLNFDPEFQAFTDQAMKWIQQAAEWIVPWEIVCPPIEFDQLEDLENLFTELRKAGAKGTYHATQFAFGLHLNPELPSNSSETITRYLQSFLCLYDWIYAKEHIDVIRKVAPFIKHFPHDYIIRVLSCDYQPELDQLMDDYLLDNPTRNRTLDLLPLFTHLDESRIRSKLPQEKINARPTLHYRLPNCDIDNPDWGLHKPWGLWLAVEALAHNPDLLQQFRRDYIKEISRLGHFADHKWVEYCDQELSKAKII